MKILACGLVQVPVSLVVVAIIVPKGSSLVTVWTILLPILSSTLAWHFGWVAVAYVSIAFVAILPFMFLMWLLSRFLNR